MIVNKHFEKIALIVVISLQGCATSPVAAPAKEEIPFTAEQAEKNRLNTERIDRQDRAINHEERMRRTEAEVKLRNAQKPDSTIILH